MCGSTREWIYCILDIVHILKQTVHLCKLSEYLYTDILCDWISKSSQDKDILCYQILNRWQDTDICASGYWMDHRTDHRTDYFIQWTNIIRPGQIGFIIVSLYVLFIAYQLTLIINLLTLLSVTVARSDWFHYCIIVCIVESIGV